MEFAEKIGVLNTTLSNIETGRNAMTEEIREKISAAFGIDFEEYENSNIVSEAKTPYNPDSSLVLHSFLEQSKALEECRKENARLLKEMIAMQARFTAEIETIRDQKATIKGQSPIRNKS